MIEYDDSKSSSLRVLHSIALLYFSASFPHRDASHNIKIKGHFFFNTVSNTDLGISKERNYDILLRRLGLLAIDLLLHQLRDTQLIAAPHNVAGCFTLFPCYQRRFAKST